MAHTKQPSSTLVSRIKSQKFKGFTLIELIVVITILAILGTIGFLSIGGYSSKARDSARIGDAAQISKSLDLSIVTAGDYPAPDNAFSITYSGGIVWNQGTIGATVMQVFRSSISWGGLNEKPIDPLSNKEYVYSELAEGKAYQIKVDYEGDLAQTAMGTSLLTYSLLDTSLVNEATAAPGNPTIAYIRGNYGGLTAKTTTGSTVYVLAIPSIITNSGTGANGRLTIESNALSGTLLFNGRPLREATTYNPNARANSGVVYSGATLPSNDTTGQITSIVNALKTAYSGADIVSNSSITNLIASTGTSAIQSLGATIIKDQLGGSAVGGGGGGNVVNNQIETLTCANGWTSKAAGVLTDGKSFMACYANPNTTTNRCPAWYSQYTSPSITVSSWTTPEPKYLNWWTTTSAFASHTNMSLSTTPYCLRSQCSTYTYYYDNCTDGSCSWSWTAYMTNRWSFSAPCHNGDQVWYTDMTKTTIIPSSAYASNMGRYIRTAWVNGELAWASHGWANHNDIGAGGGGNNYNYIGASVNAFGDGTYYTNTWKYNAGDSCYPTNNVEEIDTTTYMMPVIFQNLSAWGVSNANNKGYHGIPIICKQN